MNSGNGTSRDFHVISTTDALVGTLVRENRTYRGIRFLRRQIVLPVRIEYVKVRS